MKLSMKIKSQPWIEWRVQENLCLLLNNGSFLSEHLKKKFIFGVGLKQNNFNNNKP